MPPDKPLSAGRRLVYRHPVVVRAAHGLNALCLVLMLLSGLQILCAHPAFYWGEVSKFAHPIASVTSSPAPNGQLQGFVTLGGLKLNSTGLLGVSTDASGQGVERAFPTWATLPSELDLGAGRRWHFFFAWVFVLNGLIYVVSGLVGRRLPSALIPSPNQLRHLGRELGDHLRLRFPRGEDARQYNGLQKLTYLIVVFVLLPVMVLTGLSLSPTVDARLPWLPEIFGGRQGARTVHFIDVASLLMFVAVHLIMVLAAGPLNLLRSMLTGWLVIKPGDPSIDAS